MQHTSLTLVLKSASACQYSSVAMAHYGATHKSNVWHVCNGYVGIHTIFVKTIKIIFIVSIKIMNMFLFL